jgi:hypothetical protein
MEQLERLSQTAVRLEEEWDEFLLLMAGEREALAAEWEAWKFLLSHQILIRRQRPDS